MAEDENDKQAEALIAALAPKIAEAIIPKIAEQVETQIKGIKEKNDVLLDKLAKNKSDNLLATTQRLVDAADKQLQPRLNDDGTFNARGKGDNIKIKKSDARDVSTYRDAKALAEKEGVKLEIVAD